MKLTYRDVDFGSREDRELLARWYNDPAIKHLYTCFPDAESYANEFTQEYFLRVAEHLPPEGSYRVLMVHLDGVPIGEARVEMDPSKLLTEAPHTGWISLMIGEPHLRRCGLGTQIADHLEGLVAASGARRIEIGVFAFNEPSLRFFTRRGYEEFTRRPERVWWDGRMWADVRLLKTL